MECNVGSRGAKAKILLEVDGVGTCELCMEDIQAVVFQTGSAQMEVSPRWFVQYAPNGKMSIRLEGLLAKRLVLETNEGRQGTAMPEDVNLDGWGSSKIRCVASRGE
jgi:hypothetical protein